MTQSDLEQQKVIYAKKGGRHMHKVQFQFKEEKQHQQNDKAHAVSKQQQQPPQHSKCHLNEKKRIEISVTLKKNPKN